MRIKASATSSGCRGVVQVLFLQFGVRMRTPCGMNDSILTFIQAHIE